VGRVGGFAADAWIVIGSALVPVDLAANHHRVGGRAANPTVQAKKKPALSRAQNYFLGGE